MNTKQYIHKRMHTYGNMKRQAIREERFHHASLIHARIKELEAVLEQIQEHDSANIFT